MRAPAAAALAASGLLAALPLEAADSYAWQLPPGFPQPAVPADNPMSDAKVALGRRLFFDPLLSVNGRYSCASCHDPQRSFSDGRVVAVGATGEQLPHNALALVNVAYNVSFGWSRPQVRSLESQMLEPMLNRHPLELGLAGREASVCAALAAEREYAAAFAAAFPPQSTVRQRAAGAVTFDHVVKAIAAFERTLISGRSPFDRYVFSGEHAALGEQAKRGMALFFSRTIGCARCHAGFNFAGNWRDAEGETGRASFASNGTSATPMRVPTLRNIALTAPYGHNGYFADLRSIVDFYNERDTRPGPAPEVAATMNRDELGHLGLSAADVDDLIAFLYTLSDGYAP